MTLAELGAQLREERVSLGLTVEDVAIRLKIPARILRAIEDGDVGDLPHTVYTRGFIKGYGLILGYSSDNITELLDSLEDVTEDFSPPKTLEPTAEKNGQPIGLSRHGFGLVLKLLVIALIGAGGYVYYTHTYRDGGPSGTSSSAVAETQGTRSDASTAAVASRAAADTQEATANWQPPAGSVVSAPASEPASAQAASAAPAGVQAAEQTSPTAPSAPSLASAPASSLPASAVPASAGVNQSGSVAATMASGQPSEADPVKPRGIEPLASAVKPQAEAAASQTEVVLPAGMHQIVLTADAECWVHANADGSDTRQFSLKAGETFAMPFKKSMVLKLGNAGGVKIKYDGQDMPPAGASGQVKTVTFPPKENS